MRGHSSILAILFIASAGTILSGGQGPSSLPQLKISDNKHFLVGADGKPFFWLGDTAGELFHRATREDAERYLRKRAEQRFTVIQAVALAEMGGLDDSAERARERVLRYITRLAKVSRRLESSMRERKEKESVSL